MYKASEKTRKLANIEKIDWCDITENVRSSKNLFAKSIFEELKQIAPSAFRSCPLIGRYAFVNYTFGKAFVNMMPVGGYSVKLIGYSKETEINYYNATVLFNINSS